MVRQARSSKARLHAVAQEHVSSLHSLMRKHLYTDIDLAHRCVSHLRRVAMKVRYRLPREVKKSFCKHCYKAFAPGENCRVRLRDGKLVYYCFSCKNYTRTPYTHKKKT